MPWHGTSAVRISAQPNLFLEMGTSNFWESSSSLADLVRKIHKIVPTSLSLSLSTNVVQTLKSTRVVFLKGGRPCEAIMWSKGRELKSTNLQWIHDLVTKNVISTLPMSNNMIWHNKIKEITRNVIGLNKLLLTYLLIPYNSIYFVKTFKTLVSYAHIWLSIHPHLTSLPHPFHPSTTFFRTPMWDST